MKNQKLCNKWTEENINYLKTAYLQGSPLKQIAAKLDRSVSAINKVLARYNLRTHSRMGRLSFSLHPSARKLQQRKALGTQIRSRNSHTIKFLKTDYRHWVLFERVLQWLRAQNISIIKSEEDVYYEVDGYPKNKQQVLLIANLLREQQQLPIFYVKDITYL